MKASAVSFQLSPHNNQATQKKKESILCFSACLGVVPDAITAASGSSLLYDQCVPFAILKP
jgi:hypothetical protein